MSTTSSIGYQATWLSQFPGLSRVLTYVDSREEEYYPPKRDVFRSFRYGHPTDVRVVILGQDPYHTEGKAYGLAFGYNPKYKGPINSSLANILAEVARDTGEKEYDIDTSLEHWARQGVLLLNTRLTVAPGQPMSHAGLGWEDEVGRILFHLAHSDRVPRAFLLWGREARVLFERATGVRVDEADEALPTKLVLATSHPCRYSVHRGFSGCGHFTRTNNFLRAHGGGTIKWSGGAK